MRAIDHLRAAERIVLDALRGAEKDPSKLDALQECKRLIWKCMDQLPEGI